ncbi:LTA synthase family protein [uncultured Mitsuokella sp.]|uniref:LTA synthase family protein n=1 Tax=uncultured Mitsuokella sp. TaxID=453120 RepID=UPI0025F8913E|nr:LTA synthase family protein [uncultured Mitsuokella sp.]
MLDIFFHQNHGALLMLSYIPYTVFCWWACKAFLAIPQITYYLVPSGALQMAINVGIVLCVGLVFYYFRYGGTLIHDNKPEWDTIPSIVKEDIFMARATVDDLVALENVLKHPLQEGLKHTDEQDAPVIDAIMPENMKQEKWRTLKNPAEAFQRTAKGPHIKKPKHIFLIVGESYAQMPLDDIYSDYHIMDGAKAFRKDPHTASLNNFLPAGMISRPAIVSLMTGIFDAKLELNEREDFWHGTLATTLPNQLRKLGYRSIYWYGGNPTYGNFDKYGPAVGFDKVMGATEFCPPDSPKTWVGVYDHIFLEHAADLIREMDDDTPTFHYIYTTSNHGPYKMPLKDLGFDADAVLKDLPESVRHNHKKQKVLGTYWYSDKAISNFVKSMQETYPDALFIVTGDHAHVPIQPNDTLARQEVTLREQFCTSFAMHHPEITQDILAGNTIGGHMNIMPTIFELIAPKGFQYYSLVPSLTEPIEQVVTPYHWLTREQIGAADKPIYQSLQVTDQDLPYQEEASGKVRYAAEIAGWDAITSWIVRHPEELYAHK